MVHPALVPCPARRRWRAPRTARALPAALLLAVLGLAFAPAAHAGGCSDCPAPTLADLRQEPGFHLETRARGFTDYVETDAGECSAQLEGAPEVKLVDSWLVLRGTGEVWNCPHSRSTDTVTVQAAASDSTSWTWKLKAGAEWKALGFKFKAEVEAGRTTGRTITEVTSVSKTIYPSYCHRIAWKGWFEVGVFVATGTFRIARRYAWWTKNLTTGAAVHASGDIWMDCGSHELALSRSAPISGHFELAQRGCADATCEGVIDKHLGWFPPWGGPAGGDDLDEIDPDGKPVPDEPTDEPSEEPTDEPAEPAPEEEVPEPAPDDPDAPSEPDASGDIPEAPPTEDDVAPTGPLPDPLAP